MGKAAGGSVGARAAQGLANQGFFVVAVFRNPNPRRSGHIAIIRPSLEPLVMLDAIGPQETQAGSINARALSIALGFANHRGAWEPGDADAIRFFAHPVDWTRVPE